MLLEQIRFELETAEGLPTEALAAAMTQADALAPEIVALLRKTAEGVYLLPRQQNLLFSGLFALAAARRTEICQPFLALLRRPERQLEGFFGDGLTEFCTELLLSFYDEDPEPLFVALEDRATASGVRWALLQALARLAWEGRIPRERVVALLDRFDREEWAPAEDDAWMGWEEAVALLGLKEFEPRVRRGGEMGRFSFNQEDGYEAWLDQLNRAAANPQDPSPFIESKVIPVTDPAESLAWLAWPNSATEDFEDEDSEDEDDEESDAMPDPAETIRLSDSEIRWLDGFLVSDHVAPGALTLEHLDGFFTALAIGPVMVPPSEYMRVVWNGDGEPRYDSPEQAELVGDLLSRHWDTITARVKAMFPLEPLIFSAPLEEKGREWAEGFTMGLDLRREEWAPILGHKDAGAFVWTILALIADDYDPEAKPISLEERAQILAMLPLSILGIAAFWSNPAAARRAPARSEKIGRNQPCPCGSGRKYKKCCGAAA
jgi:yecA family protein